MDSGSPPRLQALKSRSSKRKPNALWDRHIHEDSERHKGDLLQVLGKRSWSGQLNLHEMKVPPSKGSFLQAQSELRNLSQSSRDGPKPNDFLDQTQKLPTYRQLELLAAASTEQRETKVNGYNYRGSFSSTGQSPTLANRHYSTGFPHQNGFGRRKPRATATGQNQWASMYTPPPQFPPLSSFSTYEISNDARGSGANKISTLGIDKSSIVKTNLQSSATPFPPLPPTSDKLVRIQLSSGSEIPNGGDGSSPSLRRANFYEVDEMESKNQKPSVLFTNYTISQDMTSDTQARYKCRLLAINDRSTVSQSSLVSKNTAFLVDMRMHTVLWDAPFEPSPYTGAQSSSTAQSPGLNAMSSTTSVASLYSNWNDEHGVSPLKDKVDIV